MVVSGQQQAELVEDPEISPSLPRQFELSARGSDISVLQEERHQLNIEVRVHHLRGQARSGSSRFTDKAARRHLTDPPCLDRSRDGQRAQQ